MLLNLLSGIIGGVWLAILGFWHVVIVGLALTFFGTFIVSLLLAPSLILVAPLVASEKIFGSKIVMIPLTLLSVGYTYLVMGIWGISIFWYFSRNVDPNAAIPIALWSYSTATAVWSYMAQREAQTGNEYSSLSAFFNQIGCIALMIYIYNNFINPDLYEMALWFAVPMIMSLIVQVAMMLTMLRARSY